MITHDAIFFGAIGTVADTSDMQRRAFNAAFAQAGLDWEWSAQDYAGMLATVGGVNRIEAHAARTGTDVDAKALHAAKSRIYQQMLAARGVPLRPGVATLCESARAAGQRLGWITTTSRANVDAILDAVDGLDAGTFDLITDRSMVRAPKPDPEVYTLALQRLGLAAADVLVIEDTPESAQAAASAGLQVVAFEGAAPPDSAWPEGCTHVSDLSELLGGSAVNVAAE
ncbi:HAD-IA family hydrolase [Tateyamaria sp. SN6-1]|uniref:HAD-IA family hydrolase n=1 Tax=Tateyamaria sp. SN6-1 TaxID=3092148 RepID=UPI0039F4D0AC